MGDKDISIEDSDDEEEDIEAEANKVKILGKSLGFVADDDRDLTKALVHIKKRKNKRSMGKKQKRKGGHLCN